MIPWLICTSVLILCVLALSRLLRGCVRPWILYALWLLVALRLVLPGGLIPSAWSVPSLLDNALGIHADKALEAVRPITEREIVLRPADEEFTDGQAEGLLDDEQYAQIHGAKTVPLLTVIWLAGSLLTALWIALRNVLFLRRIYRTRIIQPEYNAPLPVYAVPHLPSPCLYNGRVYLPLELRDPVSQQHAVAHEVIHKKHYDNLWNLLRCILCVVFWWDPLVWVAAYASRADMELSCDDGAIAKLGEDQRIAYGRTLVNLVRQRGIPEAPDLVPTTMVSGSRQLKRRVRTIARRPVTRRWAAAALCVVMLVLCLTTFTGADSVGAHFDPSALTIAKIHTPHGENQPLSGDLTQELAKSIAEAKRKRIPKKDVEDLSLGSMYFVGFQQSAEPFHSISFWFTRDGSETVLSLFAPEYRGSNIYAFKYFTLRAKDVDPALLERLAVFAEAEHTETARNALDGWYGDATEIYYAELADGGVFLTHPVTADSGLKAAVTTFYQADRQEADWTPPEEEIQARFPAGDYEIFRPAAGSAVPTIVCMGEDKLIFCHKTKNMDSGEDIYSFETLVRVEEPEGGE